MYLMCGPEMPKGWTPLLGKEDTMLQATREKKSRTPLPEGPLQRGGMVLPTNRMTELPKQVEARTFPRVTLCLCPPFPC